ncbi:MAG: GNAT family N-acetyltransferase [Desulfobacterales bacterium]
MEYHPLTPGRWEDFEMLFGPKGAYAGCWCMYWRTTRKAFAAGQGEGNRKAMQAIVAAGKEPGIIAYRGQTPVGWCSVAPREDFPSLNRSRVLKPIDRESVWSIVCFFIDKRHRGTGMTENLIAAAVEHVRGKGGRIVEAYPTVPRSDRVPPVSSYMGFPRLFGRMGFVAAAKASESKWVMRYAIDGA